MLSVVLPAYNEEKMIQKAADTIDRILSAEKIPYEIVFVNDGSKDHTWEEIERAAGRNPNVTGVNFSRNFGKESAMYAGLASASGDCCAVMDCDLQHPPEILVEMYRLWEQGYEVVEGVKHSRGKESALHKASAGLFYKLISSAVKIDMSRASDFKLLDRKAVNALLDMPPHGTRSPHGHSRSCAAPALSVWLHCNSTPSPDGPGCHTHNAGNPRSHTLF